MKEKQPGNLKFYPFIHAARTRIIVCLPSNQVSGVLRHLLPVSPSTFYDHGGWCAMVTRKANVSSYKKGSVIFPFLYKLLLILNKRSLRNQLLSPS